MSSPSSEQVPGRRTGRWLVQLATLDDGPELAALYASDDGFPGDIQVRFTRGANPIESLLAEGDDVVVPVVREVATGRIVGMGACVVRNAWVNGAVRRVGYLTGLKGLPEFRGGRVPVIPRVYGYLREHTPDVEIYYTTILSANTLARRLLEKRRGGMPEYRRIGSYQTTFFRGGPTPVPPSLLGGASLGGGTLDELLGLLPRDNLAPVEPPAGLTDADVRVLRDRSGNILAGCALWDQRAHKQYVVTRYSPRYERFSKLPVHWAGFPRWPRVGAPAAYSSICLLTATTPVAARRLLTHLGSRAGHLDFLMVGHVAGAPLAQARPRRRVGYSSELYTVHFEDDSLALDGRPVALDVGLL